VEIITSILDSIDNASIGYFDFRVLIICSVNLDDKQCDSRQDIHMSGKYRDSMLSEKAAPNSSTISCVIVSLT
jgi:hypothetical protein